MKKILYILLFVALFATNVSAQDPSTDPNYRCDPVQTINGFSCNYVLTTDGIQNQTIETIRQDVVNLESSSCSDCEKVANKSTSVSLGLSNILYPTQLAVKTYVDALRTYIDTSLTTKVDKTGGTITGNLTFTSPNGIDGGLRYKVGNFAITASNPDGTTYSVTGLGFKPSAIQFMGGISNTQSAQSSGYDDGTNRFVTSYRNVVAANTWGVSSAFSILVYTGSTPDFVDGTITSFDVDGFTVTTHKTNNPTGTVVIGYFAYR